MISVIMPALALVFAGLPVGEEFIVRGGVQPALSRLSGRVHIEARIALVKLLNYVAPVLIVPAVLAAIATLVVAGEGVGGESVAAWRWAGAATLLAFVLFSFLGTLPIDMRVNDWNVEALPSDWNATVQRWQMIDIYRSSAAIIAFICLTIAFVQQLS